MRVTTIQSWIYLATLFAAGVAAVVFAVFYRVPNKVTGEGILLIEKDTISQVRAQATGRLVSLRVKLGDHVEPEDVIGEISQDDLKDTINEAESKLKDLEREDLELTQFEVQRESDPRRGHGTREASDRSGPEELAKQIEDRRASREGRGPPSRKAHHERSGAARLAREDVRYPG